MRCQAMLGVEDEAELLGEERPAIETLPAFTQLRGDSELGLSRLEKLDNLRRGPAQQFELQPVELGQMPRQRLQIDRSRQCKPERPDFAALDGRSERPRAEGALVALLEQGIHTLAELGQLCLGPLAPK